MIEPRHLPNEIHPGPFEPVNLARTTAGRQRELHDRFHVRRQSRDQSVSLLASQEAHAPTGFLQHPNLRNPTQPTPILMRDVQYPPNHLESAIDSRVRDTILRLAIANVRLQCRHIDRIQPQRAQIGVQLLQMILVIEEAPLIRKLLEIAYDRLLPYENAEKPLLPSFNRLVLQADDVGFSLGAFDTPSVLAYAVSIPENEVDPPEPRILAAVESTFTGHRISFQARPRHLSCCMRSSRSMRS
jgi:hypothetical protein